MKGIRQYPPPTGFYKVCVNNRADWQSHDTARLQISVGSNPKYEGDKFFAALEWCANRFENTILIVSDTLQRHNHALPAPAAWKASRLEGDRWLWRNQKALACFNPSITRWDEWLNHPLYPTARKQVNRLVQGSEYVREELAVFLCQQQSKAIDIYAGSTLPEIQKLGMPQWLEIDMVRNKALAA